MRILGLSTKSANNAESQMEGLASYKKGSEERQEVINAICQNIFDATAGRLGTDENYVHTILDNLDSDDIALVMDSYSEVTGSEILLDVKNDFSGREEENILTQLNESYNASKGEEYTGNDDGRLGFGQKISAFFSGAKTLAVEAVNAGVNYVTNAVNTEANKLKNTALSYFEYFKGMAEDLAIDGASILLSNMSEITIDLIQIAVGTMDRAELKSLPKKYLQKTTDELKARAQESVDEARNELMENEFIAAIMTSSSKEEAVSKLKALGCDYAEELVREYITEPIETAVEVVRDEADTVISVIQDIPNSINSIRETIKRTDNTEYKAALLKSIVLLGLYGTKGNAEEGLELSREALSIIANQNTTEDEKKEAINAFNSKLSRIITQQKNQPKTTTQATSDTNKPKTDEEASEQITQGVIDTAHSAYQWFGNRVRAKRAEKSGIENMLNTRLLRNIGFETFDIESYRTDENENMVVIIKNDTARAKVTVSKDGLSEIEVLGSRN